MKTLALILLLIATPALAVDVTISIPNEKVIYITQAVAAYNAREGTSLTAVQWAKEIIRQAVIGERMQARQAEIQADADAAEATHKAAVEALFAVLPGERQDVAGDW